MLRWTAVLGFLGCASPEVPADAGELGVDPFGRIARYPFDDDPEDGVLATAGPPAGCRRCPALVPGRTGGAYAFSGAAQVVIAPQPRALVGATVVSAAVWVRPDEAPQPESVCVLGQVLANPAVENAWQMCVTQDLTVYGCMTPSCHYTSTVLVPGQWQQLALVYDGAAMRLYVGAAEVAAVPRQLSPGGDLVMGADVDLGAPVAMLVGAIDDARVWNTPLSASEIAEELAR
jgi:hypothetical protein